MNKFVGGGDARTEDAHKNGASIHILDDSNDGEKLSYHSNEDARHHADDDANTTPQQQERSRNAAVFLETLNVALGVLDSSSRERMIAKIAKAWRVSATGTMTAYGEGSNGTRSHNPSQAGGAGTGSNHLLTIPQEELLLVSRRACHILRRKLEAVGVVAIDATVLGNRKLARSRDPSHVDVGSTTDEGSPAGVVFSAPAGVSSTGKKNTMELTE